MALERSNEGLNQDSSSGNRLAGTGYYTNRIHKTWQIGEQEERRLTGFRTRYPKI